AALPFAGRELTGEQPARELVMKRFSYTHLPATRRQPSAWRILLTGGAPLLTLLALAGLFWLLGAAPTAAAPAATLYVGPDGTGTTCTNPADPCPLQAAVDVANPGDTILVAEGTYTATAAA